ncbi:MAG TPA: DUF3306 domain-containing protein [Hyphomicrobiaceae bacterium]|nr:DUF3306 domain-containing protein [Hyphomicrobiaceae bacterium]
MSGQDNFVARWSRLKRESTQRKQEARTADEAPDRDQRAHDSGQAAGRPGHVPAADATREPPFDPATLPPIDSIVADSDIRAFLQKGVPAELATAALRRAWTTDPAIRDFIGIAENQWDFTDPTAIPGFGPIGTGSDLRQLVAQAVGDPANAPDCANLMDAEKTDAEKDAVAASREDTVESCAAPDQDAAALPERETSGGDGVPAGEAAVQHPQPADANRLATVRPRGHGGALPR